MTLREHLEQRGMEVDRYSVFIDEDEYVATFLLFNLSGQLTGYQCYNPLSLDKKCNDPRTGRYYTYVPRGTDAIFGLETDSGIGPLFVVEGAFKQSKLARLGYNSIAVVGSDPKRLRPLFRILRATRPIIGIGDGDSGGSLLVRRVKFGVQTIADLDEMDDADVIAICNQLIKDYPR